MPWLHAEGHDAHEQNAGAAAGCKRGKPDKAEKTEKAIFLGIYVDGPAVPRPRD